MATLLEVCNEVLVNIGENPVNYESHPVARKVLAAYKSALRHVSALYRWPHLLQERTVTSITGGLVTLTPPVQQVLGIAWVTSVEQYLLQPQERINLWSAAKVLEPFVTAPSARPCYWSPYTDSQVRLYPQFSSTLVGNLRILVLNYPSVPVTLLGSAQVLLPDDFLQAVMYYTEYLMHIRHTADGASANQTLSTFEQYVHMLRSRKSELLSSDIWGA
jgi:hypothetical protein